MALVTSKDWNLVPNASPIANAIGNMMQQKRADKVTAQKTETLKIQQAAKTAGAQALNVLGIKDFKAQRKELAILGQNAIKNKVDPQPYVDALNTTNQDELNNYLLRTARNAADAEKQLSVGLKRLEQEQFEPVTDDEGNIVAQRNVQTGQVITDPRAGQIKKKAEKDLKADLKATDTQFERSKKLRSEITKVSTDFKKQEGAWGRVEASAVDPSPAGDLALIFNFMKVLDPGSTVREGEFAQVGAAGNLPTQAQRVYEQYATGQKLTVKQRKDVVGRAKKIFNAAKKLNKKDVGRILSVGKQFNIKKSLLLGEEQPTEQPETDGLTSDEQAELDMLRQKHPKKAL